eukprot:g20652.t1
MGGTALVLGVESPARLGSPFRRWGQAVADWMIRAFTKFIGYGSKRITADASYPYVHFLTGLGFREPKLTAGAVLPSCPCLFMYGKRKPYMFHSAAWERHLRSRRHWLQVQKAELAVQVSKPQQPSKLVGKSPFFRLKDASKLFDEIDADGDGLLGREDLLPFLRDYLGYGHAEVLNFLKVHGAGSGVELADFKRGLKDLNPYAVHDRTTQLLVRKPGAFGGIEGVDFHLEDRVDCRAPPSRDCKGCSVLICDKSEEFKVDALANCRVLIGPCTSSSFIRNCENCTFWVATRQFRVRDCSNCTFYLHCHTEPVIESSKELRIAPFNAKYPGLPKQFEEAGFDATKNYWNAVYDFTGNAKSANWSIPPLDQCEELIITFEGSSAAPEPATPELTQEMLLAAPLESGSGSQAPHAARDTLDKRLGESHGQSVTNVPQTRPSLPDSPGLKRLRRCLTDAVQELAGTLEAVVLSPEKPVEVEIEDADLVERPPGAPWTLGPKTSSSSASQKARAANAWMADHSMLAPTGATANANKPVEAFRLTMSSSPEKKEPAARPGSALGNQIDDESDDDLIFGPAAAKASSAAAAKGSSAAARRKIGEKIGVLMSSLDSDEDHEPVALSERQRKLLKEGIAGLSGRPTRPPGEESSDDEIIIEEVGLDPKPKAPPSRNHQGGEESTSESETEALAERWKSKAAAMLKLDCKEWACNPSVVSLFRVCRHECL